MKMVWYVMTVFQDYKFKQSLVPCVSILNPVLQLLQLIHYFVIYN